MIWIPIGEGYKLKVFKYGVVLLAIFACLVIGVGLYWFLQDTSVSTENSTSEFSIAHPSVTVPIKEKISSYVKDNKDSLMNAMDEVEAWSEKYYLVFKDERQILGDDGQIVGDDGQIVGDIILWPYSREYVSDDSILSFFAENDIIYGVDFPANGDVVVFETDGIGMVMSSVEMGFYFSPEDKPEWINSEQLRPFGIATGEYMNYPMIPKGNGWVPDVSVLDPEKDSLLRKYQLYTERICENFFYFESSYS